MSEDNGKPLDVLFWQNKRLKQYYYVFFFVEFSDSQVEMIPKIQQAVEYKAVGTTQLKEWHDYFQIGCTSEE